MSITQYLPFFTILQHF
uniref:Uncharacterized protein n=1 Tax=Anguilla anguilla TaxID=7936 RepID=A0A0E9RMZ2_ANGAN